MAKSTKARKSKSKKKAPVAATPTRRDTLKMFRNGAIGVLGVGAVGYFGFGSYQAYAAEHDLTRVGQGRPVVVQIHDPSCPICTALQKEARQAVKAMDDEMVFLVADITTDVGRKFAVQYGVGHVTLLLFDGAGARKQTLQGMRESDELTPIFKEHFAAG